MRTQHSRTQHRRTGVVALTATLATLVALPAGASAAAASEPGDGPVDAGNVVEKVEGLSPDVVNGVDLSTVVSREEGGVVFRDATRAPADRVDVRADHRVKTGRGRGIDQTVGVKKASG